MASGVWQLTYTQKDGSTTRRITVALKATTEDEAIKEAKESWMRIRQYATQQQVRFGEFGSCHSVEVSAPQVHYTITI